MTSRIHRGFHRIGVVLAVLPLVGAGWLGVSERNWQADTEAAQARVIASLPDIDLEKITAGVPISTALPEVHHANFTAAFALLALAAVLYAAARAVGWVLNGFMGPSRST